MTTDRKGDIYHIQVHDLIVSCIEKELFINIMHDVTISGPPFLFFAGWLWNWKGMGTIVVFHVNVGGATSLAFHSIGVFLLACVGETTALGSIEGSFGFNFLF